MKTILVALVILLACGPVFGQAESFQIRSPADQSPLSFEEQVETVRVATDSEIKLIEDVLLPQQKKMAKAIKTGKIRKSVDGVQESNGRFYFQSRDTKNEAVDKSKQQLADIKKRLEDLKSGSEIGFPKLNGSYKMRLGEIGKLVENVGLVNGQSLTFAVDTVIDKNRILMKGGRFIMATRNHRERFGSWLFIVHVENTSGLVTGNRPEFQHVFEVSGTSSYTGDTIFVLKVVDKEKLKKITDAVK